MWRQNPFLRTDNAVAIRLAQIPENHRRTKPAQRKHFFIRELVGDVELVVKRVPAEDQWAYRLTKLLAATRIQLLCDKIRLK
ncbi:unnamed protein product [Nezara viridula]|uniref:Uncharacterized protein n=1 Tax=Nezara viridula TaxID=85310 RepID=A0A9P0H011_NEZVI|nr:unnamed protein product [Nezara viridula]